MSGNGDSPQELELNEVFDCLLENSKITGDQNDFL